MSKFASLTAGLLARKGEAEPTSTPFADQLLTRVGTPSAEIRGLTPMHGHVHTHAEAGAPAKEQGFKLHAAVAAKPADSFAAVFGTFGKRAAQEIARRDAEAVKAPPPSRALSIVPDEEPAANHCGSCEGFGADDAGKTYHVNLRLKRLRFVKLKLSAALLRRPVQEIVSEALDQWFDKLPSDVMGDCACLKSRGD
ncbi:MAG: hypothetical protein JNK07_02605 [Alphaproteobacteria bacterium]|nr:hypothetical protein [Alphaproteobacteria bacterium]